MILNFLLMKDFWKNASWFKKKNNNKKQNNSFQLLKCFLNTKSA